MTDAPLLSIEQAEKVFGGGRTLFGQPKPAVHAVQDVTSSRFGAARRLRVRVKSVCGKVDRLARRMIVALDAPRRRPHRPLMGATGRGSEQWTCAAVARSPTYFLRIRASQTHAMTITHHCPIAPLITCLSL